VRLDAITRRIRLVAGAVAAAVLGVAPHVLHHVGPLAGAAIFAGAAGTALFGAIGLLAAVPMVLKMHRRTRSWRAPVAALALFAALFTVSTTLVGPAVSGESGDDAPAREAPAPSRDDVEHEEHHE
jgi:hypothetical protein